MKRYKITFEFFGKKLRTTVNANSVKEAKAKIRDKVRFDNIEVVEDNDHFYNNDTFSNLKDILGL